MYTGQGHKSVLINSAMYTGWVTLVFSRASYDAKEVFFRVCVLTYTTVIRFSGRNEVLSSSRCLQRASAFFQPHSFIFLLYTRSSCLRDNFGPSFIIVIIAE